MLDDEALLAILIIFIFIPILLIGYDVSRSFLTITIGRDSVFTLGFSLSPCLYLIFVRFVSDLHIRMYEYT